MADSIDVAAEKMLTYRILSGQVSKEDYATISTLIGENEFGNATYGKIFTTAMSIHMSGGIPDLASVAIAAEKEESKTDSKLKVSNLIQPIFEELNSKYSEVATEESYVNSVILARVVREYSSRREIDEIAEKMRASANNGSGLFASQAAVSAMDELQLLLSKSSASGGSTADIADEAKGVYERALSDKEKADVLKVPSSLSWLDHKTGGFRAGQLNIIAARPGVGKTTLALDFAREQMHQGFKVLFVSLEMTRDEVIDKLISAESNVELNRIRNNQILPGSQDHEKIRQAVEFFENNQGLLQIDDGADTSLGRIQGLAQQVALAQGGLDCLIIDYIQLMTNRGGGETRQQEVSSISRGLKMLAKQLNIPVIALAQLNREIKKDKNSTGRPALEHLRDSGQIEADASVVMFLYNHETKAEQGDVEESGPVDPEDSGVMAVRSDKTYLYLAKNRNGSTGTYSLLPLLAFSKFVEPKREESESLPF